MGRILHFQQLDAWQEAHQLVLMFYTMTRAFPAEEKYGLTSQM